METFRRATRSGWVAVAGALAIVLAALAVRGQETKESPRPSQPSQVWRLISDYEQQLADVTELARQTVSPTPEQLRKLNRLRVQQERERAQALEALRKAHAEQVRQALDAQQKQRFDAALEALEKLSRGIENARDEFLAAVGMDPAELGPAWGRYVSTADLTVFLNVTEAKRLAVKKLMDERDRQIMEASREAAPFRTANDPQALLRRSQLYQEASEKANARFWEQVASVLDLPEIAQLKKVQAAAQAYRNRLHAVRMEAHEKLAALNLQR